MSKKVAYAVGLLSALTILAIVLLLNTVIGVVPNLVGIDRETAEKIALSRGFKISVTGEKRDSAYPAGVICEQITKPYLPKLRGSAINVIVSAGIRLTIPDVTGKPFDEAKAQIEKIGLKVGKVTKEYSSEIPAGYVIAISPSAGTQVEPGTEIAFIVSKGEKPKAKPSKPKVVYVRVPNLKDKSLMQAREILESRGLRLGKVQKVTNPDELFDVIIDQNPKPGTKVKRGTAVNVIYNTELE